LFIMMWAALPWQLSQNGLKPLKPWADILVIATES
jgi:hypothetical protein